jgi:hypothetical protein
MQRVRAGGEEGEGEEEEEEEEEEEGEEETFNSSSKFVFFYIGVLTPNFGRIFGSATLVLCFSLIRYKWGMHVIHQYRIGFSKLLILWGGGEVTCQQL